MKAIQKVIKDGNQRKSYIRFQSQFTKWINSQSELKEKVDNFEEGPDDEEYDDEADGDGEGKQDLKLETGGDDEDGEDEEDEAKEETWT
eukprot:CAMPEP_0168532354 /NCGR_PEP_ID=MMETSP0405-20121227/16172_1 /TAXON_ID=498012 /ORGANISM="Trichosphaerium sp, Strain Am-I-7 wt" /LENGTH=88 /DNA_ID=CAMNT_0008557689 /DNA_START=237 /DNA_END=499 /DNA_ORIENTATION=-